MGKPKIRMDHMWPVSVNRIWVWLFTGYITLLGLRSIQFLYRSAMEVAGRYQPVSHLTPVDCQTGFTSLPLSDQQYCAYITLDRQCSKN